ncbi:MAG: hypothetical protein IJ309_02800 [Clostridia bacterium]|nr:hypothetical protein [Clostridia bacterium]
MVCLTDEGHYGSDNLIEQYCEEIACENCRVKDKTYFSVIKIKENGDFVLENSYDEHFIYGISINIGFNFSEFGRRFVDDWNR